MSGLGGTVTVKLSTKSCLFLLTLWIGFCSLNLIFITTNSRNLLQLKGLLPQKTDFGVSYQEYPTEDYSNTAQLTCMRNLKPSSWAHPKAPINYLPPPDELLSPITVHTTACNGAPSNLSVILCLNRVADDYKRHAIRQTYAQFSLFHLQFNWIILFLVGKPENGSDIAKLEKENQYFGDLIVANVAEDYYRTNLKMLIGYRYVSCFCKNANYVIKSDDDNYIRMKFLEQLITTEQSALDSAITPISGHSVRRNLYMGACGSFKIQREGRWKVSYEEYNEKLYPPFCSGGFFVMSMDVVHGVSKHCHNHCIGHDPKKFEINKQKYCLWKFEDTFVGSCIFYTQKSTAKISVSGRSAIYTNRKNYMIKEPFDKHLVVYNLHNIFELAQVHNFYLEKNLI